LKPNDSTFLIAIANFTAAAILARCTCWPAVAGLLLFAARLRTTGMLFHSLTTTSPTVPDTCPMLPLFLSRPIKIVFNCDKKIVYYKATMCNRYIHRCLVKQMYGRAIPLSKCTYGNRRLYS